MYLHRLLTQRLQKLAENFKVVLVVGARQVGKSTLLSHCFPDRKHITFDAISDEFGARADPIRFLNNFQRPLILDEIQYCPELLSLIKRYVDQSEHKGQYLLTGSQNLSVIKQAAESMAGRVGIMQLDALSIEELAENPENLLMTYLSRPSDLINNFVGMLPLKNSLYEMIWRGGMPGIIGLDEEIIPDYFSSYVKTYIERDIRLLENVQNLSNFERFVRLSAVLTAQEINYSELGRDIGINRQTAMSWLEMLKHTYQWTEIPAFHGNSIKRIAKKAKGFFQDTGLTCYLQRISSPDALASNPALGALFENFVSINLLRIARGFATVPNFYHWRTAAGAEVDLLFERDGKLYPIEIKCKGQLNQRDTRGIAAFRETYPHLEVMPGLIIYAGNSCFQLNEHTIAVPWNAMFKAPLP